MNQRRSFILRKEVWAAAHAAKRGEKDSSTTKAGEDEDNISFLGNISSYSPLERIDVLDAVFVHEGAAIENNMSGALVST